MTTDSTPAGVRAYSAQSMSLLAIRDVRDGIRLWPLWGRLGWNDILQRYRRSLLGPFWLTASMAIMVVSLGVLYANLFKTEIQDFMPFLCVGLLVWRSGRSIHRVRIVHQANPASILTLCLSICLEQDHYFCAQLCYLFRDSAVLRDLARGRRSVGHSRLHSCNAECCAREYLHRHGFGALSRHTSVSWKRYSDRFFYDTSHVETGTSGWPNLHRGAQSILPLDRGYASAVTG